jgi:hypothetical protein
MDSLLPQFLLSEAKYISVTDAGSYYIGNNVETALQEAGIRSVRNTATGLINGGVLSINADTTKFEVSPGSGQIVDTWTDPNNPTIITVTWNEFTAQTVTNIATQRTTNIFIDSNGAIIQGAGITTHDDYRDYILLGRLIHTNLTSISDVLPLAHIVGDMTGLIFDAFHAIGTINKSGNVFQPDGANLKMIKSAGETFRIGTNYNNGAKVSSLTTDALQDPVSFQYQYRNGAGGFTTTSATEDIDPNNYDDGSGTLASVTSNKWQIKLIYYSAAINDVFLIYGQEIYTSLSNAQSALANYSPSVSPALAETSLRGWLIIRQGCTDLNDTTKAVFIPAGKFGEAATGSAAGGDVLGPSSATDNSIARFDGTTGKIIQDGANATVDDNGQLALSTQGSTGGLLVGGDCQFYRSAANVWTTPDIIRADGGIGYGATPTSTVFNNFTKTVFTVTSSPNLFLNNFTVWGNTGFASTQTVNITLNGGANNSSGLGGVFGFANLSTGNMTGTAYGLFYGARDSRVGYTGTTIAGISATGQINSTCDTVYSNAVYGGVYALSDFSTGGAVPTSPSAAAAVATITFGNLTVSNAWRYFWALAGTGTTAGNVYGFEIGRVSSSSTFNGAIQLDGTNEVNNMIRWGTTNAPWLYRSANNALTLDSSSSAAHFISTGKVQANTNFNANGTDGVSGTISKNDSATVTGGIITTITAGVIIEAMGSNDTITTAETGKTFYNTAAVDLTLPTGSDGLNFRFIVQHNSYLKVIASGSDVIRYVDTVSAGGGYVRSDTVGNTLEMMFANGTWFIHSLEAKEANPWLIDS